MNTNRLYFATINIVVKAEHKGDFKNIYAVFKKIHLLVPFFPLDIRINN